MPQDRGWNVIRELKVLVMLKELCIPYVCTSNMDASILLLLIFCCWLISLPIRSGWFPVADCGPCGRLCWANARQYLGNVGSSWWYLRNCCGVVHTSDVHFDIILMTSLKGWKRLQNLGWTWGKIMACFLRAWDKLGAVLGLCWDYASWWWTMWPPLLGQCWTCWYPKPF